MKNALAEFDIRSLFANEYPDEVWSKAHAIIVRIDPAYDFSIAQTAFNDVIRLFSGNYPGYYAIQTPYHDQGHTLNVFLCAVRLMHGVQLAGARLSSDEITQLMIAALLHDIGYAKKYGDNTGTGAQYTLDHVERGVQFMQNYLDKFKLPAAWATPLECMILSTDYTKPFSHIHFPVPRVQMLGQIVGTADLVGQMADQTYLEKLLFLYLEFKEAGHGNYQSMHDMLRKTRMFYETTREKLDTELGGIYAKLALHFKDSLGVEHNYYLEYIEKNIAYLAKAASLDEKESLAMLRRNGITARAQALMSGVGASTDAVK